MSNITTVNMGYRQRFGQMSKLLYLTDGYHQPKMYDGTTLVNWGLTPPATAASAAASSSGANNLDMCEAMWTPASTVISSCESAWTLATNAAGSLATLSADHVVGAQSALILLGYAAEPIGPNTVFMMHCDETAGATSMTDSGQYSHVATARGGSVTAVGGVFGNCANTLLGGPQNQGWAVPDHPSLHMSTGDFTVDFRIRRTGTWVSSWLMSFADNGSGATGGIMITSDGSSIDVNHRGSLVKSAAWTFNLGTFYHIRVCRASGVLYLFINGVLQGAGVAFTSACDGAFGVKLIYGQFGSATPSNADIDEVRIDKGVALSTSDFITPTTAYGSYAAPTADPLGIVGLISSTDITPTDYSGYYGIQFWVKTLKTMQAGDLALSICDSGGAAVELERISIPVLQAGQWTKITYKFLTPAVMTSVASLGLYLNRDVGQNGIYLDDVRAIRCFVSLETDPTLLTQGAASVRLDIPGNVPSGTLLAFNALGSTNMTGDNLVSASIRCNRTIGYQQFKYLLDDSAECATPLEAIYFPDNLAAESWHSVTFSLVTPAALTAVISHGIYLNSNSIGPCSLWIDDIKRAVVAAGNLTGRYFVWVSYYNSRYDIESDLSPISAVATCTGQALSLSSIPISADTQVDMRRIYRSAAGGTVPYLDSTINDNTTATLVLNKSDAAILAAIRHPSLMAGAGKFQAPPAAPYLVQNKNRFMLAGSKQYNRGTVTTAASATFTFTSAQLDDSFIGRYLQIIGDTTNYLIMSVNAGAKTCVARPIDDLVAGIYRGTPAAGKSYYISSGSENTVYTSYVDDDDVARPHGFPIEFAQDITEGVASDVLSGLGKVGDSVLAMKYFSTHLLEGAYPPYSLSQISSVIGCISHDTIVQDENGMALWLAGEQGVALCNGSSVSLVSSKIEDIFSGGHALSLNSALFPLAHAVYDTKEKMYYLFCASAASSTNDVCIVFDKSSPDQAEWKWYYFTGIEASASTIVYSTTGLGAIYITDYDGFQYQLNVGWYDGVSAGTLSGVATSVVGSTLNDTLATFYTTGSGLRNIPLLVYKISTGETWVYKIASNTGTGLTITGAFTEAPSTSDYRYYIGGYQIDWKSKQFELMRPTDKKLLMDGVLNNYKLSISQKVRIQLLKNLAGTQIANQLRDLSEGEEQVLLVRERVSQAQWQISGFIHGQNIQIVSLGLRLKGRGIR